MHVPISARSLGRRRVTALLAAGITAAGGVAALGPMTSDASSHREAPLTAGDPKIDNTDTYAFVSPDRPNTVTLVANWIPFEEPNGGPNFYPWADDAHYDINIDSNGDAKPDVTYRWTFTSAYKNKGTFLYNTGPVNSINDPTLNFTQTYKLEEIRGTTPKTLIAKGKVAPSDVGKASMPNYASLRDQAITPYGTAGAKSFVGQADDSFFLDLRVFDLLYGGNLKEVGSDTLDGYNVNTIALQVPKSDLVKGGDPVIGVWSTTERQATRVLGGGTSKSTGDFVQVSRLGNPLVNEVVVPVALKDAFNSLPPEKDATIKPVVDRVNDPEVPKLIQKIYGLPAPKAPRDDLFSVFLTGVKGLNMPTKTKVVPAEMLRLNTSIPASAHPNRLGVLAKDLAGFPNGRRLTDDVVDIELQALEGAVRTGKLVPALAAGDGVNTNDVAFGKSFPYVALPHDGSVNNGVGSTSSSGTPSGGAATGGGGTAAGQSSGTLPVLPASAALLGLLLAAGGVVALRRNAA
jgi:Rieske Fe-S protein